MSKTNKILAGISIALIVIIIVLLIVFLANRNGKTYTVTFNTNGGTIVEQQKVSKNGKVLKPQTPTRKGYIFDEWKCDNQTYDFNTPVTKDIILVASWKKDSSTDEDSDMVTIRFDTDGGSTVSRQIIPKGDKVTKPADPTKTDYKFVEWQLDDKKFDFETEVEENITLKAKWEKAEEKVTVTFNSDGGSSVAKQEITKGSKATKPKDPTKNGYTFNGWTLNGATFNFNNAVNSNITLKASWKANSTNNNTNNNNNSNNTSNNTNNNNNNNNTTTTKYTVTFDSQGGSSVPSQTVIKGGKVTKPTNPTKDGYDFLGWLLADGYYNFSNPVNSNITLKASWKVKEVTPPPTPTPKTYTIRATPVDDYSPQRYLTVYEDGTAISFQSISVGGYTLCTGSNPKVNQTEIAGVSSFTVILSDGSSVTATLG